MKQLLLLATLATAIASSALSAHATAPITLQLDRSLSADLALNPQPLPPRWLNPQPLPPRLALNPQPIPPRR
jgi:opacity protein-like surface antigen